jgi:hypothetical protein
MTEVELGDDEIVARPRHAPVQIDFWKRGSSYISLREAITVSTWSKRTKGSM